MSVVSNPQTTGVPGSGAGSGGGGSGGGGGVTATQYQGQAVIATTGTAVQLISTSTPLTNGLIVTLSQLNSSGTSNTLAGTAGATAALTNVTNGTGNGYVLAPGGSQPLSVNDASLVYVNGTAGQVFSWTGS